MQVKFPRAVIGARWGGLLLVLATAATAACSKKTASAQTEREVVAVNVAPVERRDVPFELQTIGTVEASSTVEVLPQVTGLVTEIHFKEGDLVKKGDKLFSIDTRPYRASLAVAQAELARSRALAEQARSEAERYAKLHAEGLASEQEMMKAQADAASSRAAVELGQAQKSSANLNVLFAHITSPIEGKAGSLLVYPGNVVSAGARQPLVVIRRMAPVFVRFAVPEQYLPQIRQRMGESRLVVRAKPRGLGVEPAEGELTFLENTVDAATGTLTLKATFQNTRQELWPGASVEVTLTLGVDRQVVVAPEAAVQEGQDGHYAFAIEGGNRAVLRPVTLIRSTDTLALIRSGLNPGEQVVTDGQVRLKSGMAVQIKPNAATTRVGAQ